MKKIIIAGLLSISAVALFSQEFKRDTIEKYLRTEIQDSTGAYNTIEGIVVFEEEIKNMLGILEKSRKDTFALFPYQYFDSAIHLTFAPLQSAGKPSVANSGKLNDVVIGKLLRFVNNPLYFSWAECGTPDPQSRVVFYSKGVEIASVSFACDKRQILITPKNPLSRYGAIEPGAQEIIKKLGL